MLIVTNSTSVAAAADGSGVDDDDQAFTTEAADVSAVATNVHVPLLQSLTK